MNANEVIARLASQRARQRRCMPTITSTWARAATTCIPTRHPRERGTAPRGASCCRRWSICATVLARQGARRRRDVVKTGRTHLMDAMPVTLGAGALRLARADRERRSRGCGRVEPRLLALAQGGTAVGTGINAHAGIRARASARSCATLTGVPFAPARNYFEAHGDAGRGGGIVRPAQGRWPSALMKIANDLRWMNSGPLAGLGEIALPALQPGSSIMPGKVNPVIPEARRHGRRAGHRQRCDDHRRRPVGQLPAQRDAAADRHQPAECDSSAGQRRARPGDAVHRRSWNPMSHASTRCWPAIPILATALNPVIGYERAAAIAKRPMPRDGRCSKWHWRCRVSRKQELRRLLDPAALTRGGLQGGGGSG